MHTWLLLGILLFSGLDGWDWMAGGRADRSWGANYTPTTQVGTATAMDGDIPPPPPPKP